MKEMFTPDEKGSGSAMLHVAPWLLSVAEYIGGVAGCRGHYGGGQDPGHAAPLGRHGHQDTLLAQHPLQVTRSCQRSIGFHNHGEGPFYYYSVLTFKTLF